MTKARQAIMVCSRQLIEELLPKGKVLESVADRLAVELAWVAEMLRLPSTARVTGVSMAWGFLKDQVTFRIESPDFVETMEGNTLPEVQAIYDTGLDKTARFAGWMGNAVRADIQPAVVKFHEFL